MGENEDVDEAEEDKKDETREEKMNDERRNEMKIGMKVTTRSRKKRTRWVRMKRWMGSYEYDARGG